MHVILFAQTVHAVLLRGRLDYSHIIGIRLFGNCDAVDNPTDSAKPSRTQIQDSHTGFSFVKLVQSDIAAKQAKPECNLLIDSFTVRIAIHVRIPIDIRICVCIGVIVCILDHNAG